MFYKVRHTPVGGRMSEKVTEEWSNNHAWHHHNYIYFVYFIVHI